MARKSWVRDADHVAPQSRCDQAVLLRLRTISMANSSDYS
jgi:hypothetical protein